jgi:transposase
VARSDTRRSGNVAEEEVVLGVDKHLDFHVAVAVDRLGRPLGELKVPTTTAGYRRLVSWAKGFGPVRCAGVEGTGSYGAGLARHLKAAGIPLMEVERPKRRHLRRKTVSPTPKTPRPPPVRFWPERRRAYRRAETAVWR